MNIITCLKPIVDPDIVEYDLMGECFTNTFHVLNPVDYCVLEEGLLLREQTCGTLTAVSVASAEADGILREALLSGAERAVRIWSEELQSVGTRQIADAIGVWLDGEPNDIILTGTKSADTGSCFMAAWLAHLLRIPLMTNVVGVTLGNGGLIVDKKMEKGRRIRYRVSLPAVIGVEASINIPRYTAPYSRVYREGLRKKIETVSAHNKAGWENKLIETVKLVPSRPRVKAGLNVSKLTMRDKMRMMKGELGRKKRTISGSADEAAKEIAAVIREVLG